MQRLVRATRWLWNTSWPVYAVLILGTNVAGAAAIMAYIRFLIPIPELRYFEPGSVLPTIGIVYVAVAAIVGVVASYFLFRPVIDWQRDPDSHDPIMVRGLVLRLPIAQALVCLVIWLIGIAIAVIGASTESGRLALTIGLGMGLAGLVVALITYLEAERAVRPIAAEALAQRNVDVTVGPSLPWRLRMTWAITTGLPLIGVLLLLWGQTAGYFHDDFADLVPAILFLVLASMVTGFVGTTLTTMSVVDPVHELQHAINQVRRGDTNAEVDIYDGSEIGVLQAGFNEMLRGLKERRRLQDIFGHYVGTEVAARALEERPTLGGEDRKVAVLFVDVVGSTSFAVNHPPEEVVGELNRFFEQVVAAVHRNKGVINKFQGDAALAIFGAPLRLSDANSAALTAARELRTSLKGLKFQAGLGVCAGHVVAGHVGGADRFEYTVIGDAVNQAARITELAKNTPGKTLTTAATLRGANEAERARWTTMKSVELRGRREVSQLARPIRETLAERSE